jgi:hypothetical protein
VKRVLAVAAAIIGCHALPRAAAPGSGPVFVMAAGSLRLPVIERLARQGRMPALVRLLREAAVAPELLYLYPIKSCTPWIS